MSNYFYYQGTFSLFRENKDGSIEVFKPSGGRGNTPSVFGWAKHTKPNKEKRYYCNLNKFLNRETVKKNMRKDGYEILTKQLFFEQVLNETI